MLLEAAQSLLAAGLCVLPASPLEKRPTVRSWKEFQERLPTGDEVTHWFQSASGLCLLTGSVSGNLELLDFDVGGELFPAWCDIVNGLAPDLLSRLVIERSQSGGRHVVYRSAEPVSGNAKLAARVIDCHSGDEIEYAGKRYRPRKHGGKFIAVVNLIETRGQGGLFLCAPTPGYEIEQLWLEDAPTLTAVERGILLSAARSLNEWDASAPTEQAQSAELRPGDDFNARADFGELLRRHGWSLAQDGENQHWTRPGKARGTSATLKGRVLYVFSSNADPFEPDKAYSAFSAFALLEHSGDFHAAAVALHEQGFGSAPAEQTYGVDLSGLIDPIAIDEEIQEPLENPGDFPADLLSVPGFIGDVMAYNLATAPRQQPILALAGAICLQAILAGRKIADYRGNRTNLYIVSLASSASGKGHAMKVNQKVLHLAGAAKLVGSGKLPSDAGILTMLMEHPARLVQIDEFGRYLATMGDAQRNPHLHGIVTTLMELFTSADTIYFDKAYADAKKIRDPIDQPCLVLHCVSATEPFNRALTTESLTDGSLARMMIFAPPKEIPELGDVAFPDPPESLITTARAWHDYRPAGNLSAEHPIPTVAHTTDDARAKFQELSKYADGQMRIDPEHWRGAIWGRAVEKACRLALIYACSAIGTNIAAGEVPTVDSEAAEWGCRLSGYLTRKLIVLAHENVSEGSFDALQNRIAKAIGGPGESISVGKLANKLYRVNPRLLKEALDGMRSSGRLELIEKKTGGRSSNHWRMRW